MYRAATVSVNSNIDKEIEAAGEKPENYRSLSRLGSIDSVTLVAEAKDFPGYQFDHWATGYVDDSNQGTTVTDNSNFVLRGSRPFDGILYTAVYVKVHEVRYHDIPSIRFTSDCLKGTGFSEPPKKPITLGVFLK